MSLTNDVQLWWEQDSKCLDQGSEAQDQDQDSGPKS